jgi:cytochrome c556
VNKAAAALWLTALATTSATPVAADEPTPAEGPGWTGLTRAADVVAARQALMAELERLMQPIDSLAADQTARGADPASAALTISRLLLAAPHLFPPTTNLYDPAAEKPETIALPAIWQDFDGFYALAGASAAAAAALAEQSDPAAQKAGGLALRATCDACHARFLRTYVPQTAGDEDTSFDFDAVFGDGKDSEGKER